MEDQEHTQSSGSPPPPASPLTVQDSDEEDGTLSLTVASKTPEKPEAQTTVDVPTRSTRPSTKAGRLRASGGGGREDCWSDGATSTLIDAWGERFFELSRGNLKQKHWQEVAAVVSSRDDYTRTPKTDVQCKNRIDTLKKKYKVEKSKMSSKSTSLDWPFFKPLDDLIGGNNPHNSSTTTNNNDNKSAKKKKKKKAQQKRSKLDLRFELQACKKTRSKKKMIPRQLPGKPTTPPSSPPEFTGNGGGFENGLREMVKAVVKVGEVYERVEKSKLEQAAEMEKQRMKFAKEMELHRMRFFMKSQLELTQLNLNQNLNCRKRRRMTSDDDDDRDVGDHEHAPATAAGDSNSNSNSNNISGGSKKKFKNGVEL